MRYVMLLLLAGCAADDIPCDEQRDCEPDHVCTEGGCMPADFYVTEPCGLASECGCQDDEHCACMAGGCYRRQTNTCGRATDCFPAQKLCASGCADQFLCGPELMCWEAIRPEG